MKKIALCDDKPEELQDIITLLEKYIILENEKIEYEIVQNSFELISSIEKETHYDIIFLDVIMPGINGIEVAKEIRKYDTSVKIIFLTSSVDYAIHSYTVGAFYYLLKPITEEKFLELRDLLRAEYLNQQSCSFVLKCKNGITKVECIQLEYCEVIGKTVFLHLHNGNVLESSLRLSELVTMLEPYECFYRAHRSYLVNMEYIHNISYQGITMSDHIQIPIPRGKYAEIKNTFLEYAFQGKRVIL